MAKHSEKKDLKPRSAPKFVGDSELIWIPGMEKPQTAGEYKQELAAAKPARAGIERTDKIKEFLGMLIEDFNKRKKQAKKGEIVVIAPKHFRQVNTAFKEVHRYGAGIALGYLKKNGYMKPIKTGVLGFGAKTLELLEISGGIPVEPELGKAEEEVTSKGLKELAEESEEEPTD